jgi:hypothetical protein
MHISKTMQYHIGGQVEDPIDTLRNCKATIEAAEVDEVEFIAELRLGEKRLLRLKKKSFSSQVSSTKNCGYDD